jgi:methylenetetrahydrofolate dehydrogenase (NADP+) / methenyltetrahydrofolate cyclohydrolase
MVAKILDGRTLAATMRQEMAAVTRPVMPKLVAVIVGDNPASHTYVKAKRKACAEAGLASDLITLPASASQAELLGVIDGLNHDARVHGILVQLPLPKHMDEEAVIHAVTPLKDVDCFHPQNVGLLMTGHPRFYPCTPHGCVELVRRNGIDWSGQHVVIVGRSNIVGKPLAVMLMQKPTAANPAAGDATVTVAHTKTPDLAAVCRSADILVAATGQAWSITPTMVKPGAVVVDVGTTVVDGKLRGDVHPDCAAVAGWLSPVPGGVGPMTITMLLANTLQAAVLASGTGVPPA